MTRPAIHPGEILADELEELKITAAELAENLNVPATHITEILNKEKGISADMALRLGRWFRISPEFWLNLQKSYELRLAKKHLGKQIETEVKPRIVA